MFRSLFYLNLVTVYVFYGMDSVFFMLAYFVISIVLTFLLASGITFFRGLRKNMLESIDLNDKEAIKLTNPLLGCI